MSKRQVPAAEISFMLSGEKPHPIKSDNHKSFYDNWDFSIGEVNKLILWAAASIVLDGEKMPKIIHPLGVAFMGGKGRLIVNLRYCNLL
jgi:hypothetical protein